MVQRAWQFPTDVTNWVIENLIKGLLHMRAKLSFDNPKIYLKCFIQLNLLTCISSKKCPKMSKRFKKCNSKVLNAAKSVELNDITEKKSFQ